MHKDESIAFGFDINTDGVFDYVIKNFTEVSIAIYDSEPDDGDSTFLNSVTLSTSCPGPWTIGS